MSKSKNHYVPVYMPTKEYNLMVWIGQYLNSVKPYLAMFQIETQDYELEVALYDRIREVFACSSHVPGVSQALTEYKRILLYSSTHGSAIAPQQEEQIFPQSNSESSGLVKLIDEQVKQIKASPRYTTDIGKQLGIEPAAKTPVDWEHITPDFSLEQTAGHVYVRWVKGSADGADIECDHGSEVFAPLATAMRTPYIDPTGLPEKPQVWRYRVRYRKGDQEVGNWSEIREITVRA